MNEETVICARVLGQPPLALRIVPPHAVQLVARHRISIRPRVAERKGNLGYMGVNENATTDTPRTIEKSERSDNLPGCDSPCQNKVGTPKH